MIPNEIYRALKRVDTPTVCNAIEVAFGKRGFANFTRSQMVATETAAEPMVGRALTATIRAMAPPADPPEAVRKRRADYYRYVSETSCPSVIVIQDLDGENVCGAFWGEVNATVHKAFGLQGAVTNGLVRDLGALPAGFPVLAGSIGVSHAFVHVVEIDVPVTVSGMAVNPGDLVHADRHGALVIPEDRVAAMPEAVQRLEAAEGLVLGPAREAGPLGYGAFLGNLGPFRGRPRLTLGRL